MDLGDINFGIGVDTSALREATAALEDFRAKVDGVAASTLKAAEAPAKAAPNMGAAYLDRITAMQEASRRINNLNRQMARAGGTQEAMGTNLDALEQYIRETQRAGITADEFQASQDKLNAAIARGAQELEGLKMASRNVAPYRREHVIAQSIQEVANLNQRIARSGASPELIARNEEALRGLTEKLTAGKMSTTEFVRAQDEFKAVLGDSRRAAIETIQPVNRFRTVLRELQTTSALALGPLNGIGYRISSLAALSSEASFKIAGFVAGVVGASFALYKMTKTAAESGVEYQQLMATLDAATGSAGQANLAYDKLTAIADRLGQKIQVLAPEFARLYAASRDTNLQGAETVKIFDAIVTAGTALRLSSQRVNNMLLAVREMMDKGVIQSRQLRRQLGDSLPGAMKIFEQATGMSAQQLNKLMSSGRLLTADVLPKVADLLLKLYSGPAAQAAKTLPMEWNKLSNAIFEFGVKLNLIFDITGKLGDVIKGLTDTVKFLTAHIQGFTIAMTSATAALAGFYAPEVLTGILAVAKALKALAAVAFGVDVTLDAAGGWLALLGRLAAGAAAAGATYLAMKHVMDNATDSIKHATRAAHHFLNGTGAAGESGLSKNFDSMLNKIIKIYQATDVAKAGIQDVLQGTDYSNIDKAFNKAYQAVRKMSEADASAAIKRITSQGYELGDALKGAKKQLYDMLTTRITANLNFKDVTKELKASQDASSKLEGQLNKLSNAEVVLRNNTLLTNLSRQDRIKGMDMMREHADQLIQKFLGFQRPIDAYEHKMGQIDKFQAWAKQNLQGQQLKTTLEEIQRAQLGVQNKYNGITQATSSFKSATDSAITSAITQWQGFGTTMKNVLDSVLNAFLKLMVQVTLLTPMENAMSNAGGKGLLSNFFHFLGVPHTNSPHALGTVINAPTNTPFGRVGEMGPEGVLPLTRTASGDLGVKATGGGSNQPTIQIIDQRHGNAPAVQVSHSQTSSGQPLIRMLIRSEVKGMFSDSSLDATLNKNYGLKRQASF